MSGLAISCRLQNITLHLVQSSQMLHDQIHQESNFNNFKHAFYEACHARRFMKHVKNTILSSTPRTPFFKARQPRHFQKLVILWNTPGTSFYEARQAIHFLKHPKYVSTPSSQSMRARQAREHVKHANTLARHLTDSFLSQRITTKEIKKTDPIKFSRCLPPTYLSVFSSNAEKYGPKKLRIRTLFMQ